MKGGYTVFAHVIDGSGRFDDGAVGEAHNCQVVLYGDGAEVAVRAHGHPLGFFFLSGRPIWEPVAWAVPIVMNTGEEVREAFTEYREGTFVKEVEGGSMLF